MYQKINTMLRKVFWLFLVISGKLGSQVWSDPITGSQPGNSQNFQSSSGTTVNANISVSGISKGSGLSGNNANDRYNADQWNLSALDANDYFTFTLTPISNNPSYQIYFSSFTYIGQTSTTGPVNFAFRSSLDGFASDIGFPTATGASIDLSNIIYQRLTASIEFRLYAWGGSNNNGTFSVNNFSFNGFVKLPIQLTSFDLSFQNGKPNIRWSSLSEQNNHYYSLERSTNAKEFDQIRKINGFGLGTTDKKIDYIHVDQNPLPGINYYRLRQVDIDGTETVYPVKSIFIKPDKTIIYPTVFDHRLSVLFEQPIQIKNEWKLINMHGQSVANGRFDNQSLNQEIHLGFVCPGVYSFIIFENTKKERYKLIKK